MALLPILALQSILSGRLIGQNSAFTDEGLYLWAGRLEWLHAFHGTRIPPFATYFSGAPVLYPPLGAAAVEVGGLSGARVLSLLFMLLATALLWDTTRRLFGEVAAFFAAASWAMLGPTIFLGALATFDAMSICLMGLAAWCLTRSAGRLDFTRWMVAAAAALTLANVACYSSIIFDPFLIVFAVLVDWPRPERRVASMKAAAFASYLVTALVLLAALGGSYYYTGLDRTVLARATGTSTTRNVVDAAWGWSAVVVVPAIVAVIISLAKARSLATKALLTALALAGVVVPIEQARLHTATSLDKHVDAGAWLAAIAVGYAVQQVTTQLPRVSLRRVVTAIIFVAVCLPVTQAIDQARQLHSWANSDAFIEALRPLVTNSKGPILVETPSPARFALERTVPWVRWSDTYSVTLPDGKSEASTGAISAAGDPRIYDKMLRRGYFSIIALYGYATPGLDQDIERDIGRDRMYTYVATVPYGGFHYTLWRRTTVRALK